MLDKTTISKLQAVLGIDNLAELIAAEETHVIQLPPIYTEEEKNTYGTNRFEEGKKAFGEIWTKDMKAKHPEVQYEGKNAEQFLAKYAEAKIAETGIEPEEKVKKFKAENEELRTKLQEAIDKESEIKNTYEQKIFGLSTSQQIAQLIPEKTIIPRSHILTLFNSEITTEKDEDGKIYHKKGGEILKDAVGNYKTTSDVVSEFVDTNKFAQTGGMGGGDEGGGSEKSYKSMSSFMDGMEKLGIEPMSAEGQKILIESKKSEDFDVNG